MSSTGHYFPLSRRHRPCGGSALRTHETKRSNQADCAEEQPVQGLPKTRKASLENLIGIVYDLNLKQTANPAEHFELNRRNPGLNRIRTLLGLH